MKLLYLLNLHTQTMKQYTYNKIETYTQLTKINKYYPYTLNTLLFYFLFVDNESSFTLFYQRLGRHVNICDCDSVILPPTTPPVLFSTLLQNTHPAPSQHHLLSIPIQSLHTMVVDEISHKTLHRTKH